MSLHKHKSWPTKKEAIVAWVAWVPRRANEKFLVIYGGEEQCHVIERSGLRASQDWAWGN